MLFRGNRFMVNFVVAFLATYVGLVFVQTATGLQSSLAVIVILPLIIASMIEGQEFVRRHNARPSAHLCWIASLRMTAFVVLLSVVLFVMQLTSQPHKMSELEAIEPSGRAAAFLLLVFLTWGVLRIGYAIGLASELKGQQLSDD